MTNSVCNSGLDSTRPPGPDTDRLPVHVGEAVDDLALSRQAGADVPADRRARRFGFATSSTRPVVAHMYRRHRHHGSKALRWFGRPSWPPPQPASSSFGALRLFMLATAAEPMAHLIRFYRRTRPGGWAGTASPRPRASRRRHRLGRMPSDGPPAIVPWTSRWLRRTRCLFDTPARAAVLFTCALTLAVWLLGRLGRNVEAVTGRAASRTFFAAAEHPMPIGPRRAAGVPCSRAVSMVPPRPDAAATACAAPGSVAYRRHPALVRFRPCERHATSRTRSATRIPARSRRPRPLISSSDKGDGSRPQGRCARCGPAGRQSRARIGLSRGACPRTSSSAVIAPATSVDTQNRPLVDG